MFRRRVLEIALGVSAIGGVLITSVLAWKIAHEWSPAAAWALGVGVLLMAGGGLLGGAVIVRRVLRSLRALNRSVRAQADDAASGQDAVPTRLLVALGPSHSSAALGAYARQGLGRTIVVTDQADLIAPLSRVVSVEYLPGADPSADPSGRVAFAAARVAEVAIEQGASVIQLWADGQPTGRWSLSTSGPPARSASTRWSSNAWPSADVVKQVRDEQAASRKTIERRIEHGTRDTRRMVDGVYKQIEALMALYTTMGTDTVLPAMRGWAISPDLALHLVRLVSTGEVTIAIETGSGSSTVILAAAFELFGTGEVVSLEHDRTFAEATRRELDHRGLAHRATVVHAPLVDVDVDGEVYRWYDLDGVDLPLGADLVLVDGPPEATGHHARYPAVPMLRSYLAPIARVVLDDGDRPGEREVAGRWAELPGVVSVRTLAVEREAVELVIGSTLGAPGSNAAAEQ